MKKPQVPSRVLRPHFENNCSVGSLLFVLLSLPQPPHIKYLCSFFFSFISYLFLFLSPSLIYFFSTLLSTSLFFWLVPPFFTLPTEHCLLCFLQVIHENEVFLKKELCWRILERYIIFLIYSSINYLCKW